MKIMKHQGGIMGHAKGTHTRQTASLLPQPQHPTPNPVPPGPHPSHPALIASHLHGIWRRPEELRMS